MTCNAAPARAGAEPGMAERDKLVRFVQEMRNVETDAISAITVLVAVHMDTAARKACPLPQHVAEKARACSVDCALPG